MDDLGYCRLLCHLQRAGVLRVNPVSEEISEQEAFANGFFYLVKAIKMLAEDADAQCKHMKNYNVAWELKDDISRSAGVLKLPGARELSQAEVDGIAAMVAALKELPASLLVAATTEAANKKAMNDPRWIPLRARAAELLRLLAATTKRVEVFLGEHSS